jgi:acyl-CoA reductase-like NAD-dependent aldehyde dehydrogenase
MTAPDTPVLHLVINPAAGQVLAEIPYATAADIDRAVRRTQGVPQMARRARGGAARLMKRSTSSTARHSAT